MPKIESENQFLTSIKGRNSVLIGQNLPICNHRTLLPNIKVSKGVKIRNQYNQVPHLTQDTNGTVTNSQLDTTTRAKRSALSQQVTTKHILTDAHKDIANTR